MTASEESTGSSAGAVPGSGTPLSGHVRIPLNLRGAFLAVPLTWVGLLFFFELDFSELLRVVDSRTSQQLVLLIVCGFSLGFAAKLWAQKRPALSEGGSILEVDLDFLLRRTIGLTWLFLAGVSFEFVLEGYVPLLAFARGANISHFDFGIGGVHGLLMSVGSMLFTVWFFYWRVTGRTISLAFMALILSFFVLAVTRKMIVVSFAQAALVAYMIGLSRRAVLSWICSLALLVVLFGWIGDVRTGRELFLSLARMDRYPEWLPTGLGWVYIYLTTPLANLANAASMDLRPTNDLSFALGWLPSVVRDLLIARDTDAFDNVWQISGAFNVGTGFMPLLLSFGTPGVGIFAFLVGFAYRSALTRVDTIVGLVVAVVVAQCTLLLVFANNFFNLNTISQVLFAALLYRFVVASDVLRAEFRRRGARLLGAPRSAIGTP